MFLYNHQMTRVDQRTSIVNSSKLFIYFKTSISSFSGIFFLPPMTIIIISSQLLRLSVQLYAKTNGTEYICTVHTAKSFVSTKDFEGVLQTMVGWC